MKRSKVFEQILNGLVLLGSLAIIIVASIELLDGNNALSETFILKFHLWVCGLFLADFFVRWYTDGLDRTLFGVRHHGQRRFRLGMADGNHGIRQIARPLHEDKLRLDFIQLPAQLPGGSRR